MVVKRIYDLIYVKYLVQSLSPLTLQYYYFSIRILFILSRLSIDSLMRIYIISIPNQKSVIQKNWNEYDFCSTRKKGIVKKRDGGRKRKRKQGPRMQLRDILEGQYMEIQAFLTQAIWWPHPSKPHQNCSHGVLLSLFILHIILLGKWVDFPCTEQG